MRTCPGMVSRSYSFSTGREHCLAPGSYLYHVGGRGVHCEADYGREKSGHFWRPFSVFGCAVNLVSAVFVAWMVWTIDRPSCRSDIGAVLAARFYSFAQSLVRSGLPFCDSWRTTITRTSFPSRNMVRGFALLVGSCHSDGPHSPHSGDLAYVDLLDLRVNWLFPYGGGIASPPVGLPVGKLVEQLFMLLERCGL